MLCLLASREESFTHHWVGNSYSRSLWRADIALSSGFVLTRESFYHIGNCSFLLCLVSEVFILETDSLVTKKNN